MPMHCSANRGPGRRCGDLLRPFGHRQNHAVGRRYHALDRRRRAWLVRTRAFSISKAAATPRRSACRARPSPRSTPPPRASAPCSRTSSLDPLTRLPDFDDGSKTENTRAAYPLDFIANASPTGRAGDAEERRHAHLRRFRRVAADRQAHPRRSDVSFSFGLHRQGGRHREGRERSGSHLLHLLRRALHAASPDRSTATCCATLSPSIMSIAGS